MTRILLNHGGLTREYLLAAPLGASCAVVFLHGKGGAAAWADGETGWSQLAHREGFALALPQGLPPDPSLPLSFLTNPPYWNDGHSAFNRDNGHAPDHSFSSKNPDDVGFLDAVLDDLTDRLEIPRPLVFLTGFSNGAGMTFRLAAERANRLAAIAPVAGHYWHTGSKPDRPVPTLYMVGTVDPLIPLRGGRVRSPWTGRLDERPSVNATLEHWAQAIECSEAPLTEMDAGGVRVDIYPGSVPFRSMTIEGLGHHWPGGRGQLNPRIAGPASDQVNATQVIWKFFQQIALKSL